MGELTGLRPVHSRTCKINAIHTSHSFIFQLALAVHSAIENNTLMMETFTGKPVFRYVRDCSVESYCPCLKTNHIYFGIIFFILSLKNCNILFCTKHLGHLEVI